MDFEMLVPKRCRPVVLGSSGEPFHPLARFVDTQNAGFSLRVDAGVLPVEIGTADFLEGCETACGRTVLQRREWEEGHLRSAEIFSEGEGNGSKWLRRIRMLQAGTRVYRIEASAPTSAFAQFAEEAACALLSFRLLKPTQTAYAERILTTDSEAGGMTAFHYPCSWQLRSTATSFGMEHILTRAGAGLILVREYNTSPEQTKERLFHDFAAFVRGQGIRICGAPVVRVSAREPWEDAMEYVPAGRDEHGSLHVGAWLSHAPGCTALVGVISPTKQRAHWQYAVAQRAARIVLDSLSPAARA
ncbi:MAG: hypothetical protein IT169_11970 [Bryobacterales bacterium]|nr:hypothetical protein [Bryobacterales bacterium]